MSRLTHLNERGEAHMVDVSDKEPTVREAVAHARVQMSPDTLRLIAEGGHKKGDVLAAARIAGIQAAKRTSELIPLCHPLMITAVQVEFAMDAGAGRLDIETRCRVQGPTGVEMEALTAAAVAALTVYDMCKGVDRGMVIERVHLVEKKGGRSGHWRFDGER